MINMEFRIIHEGTRGQTLQLVSSDDQSILMESLIDQLKNHRGDRFIGSHVCCKGIRFSPHNIFEYPYTNCKTV